MCRNGKRMPCAILGEMLSIFSDREGLMQKKTMSIIMLLGISGCRKDFLKKMSMRECETMETFQSEKVTDAVTRILLPVEEMKPKQQDYIFIIPECLERLTFKGCSHRLKLNRYRRSLVPSRIVLSKNRRTLLYRDAREF